LTPAANVKNKIERIKWIRDELMQTIKDLRAKIQALETERSSLMSEIENLRKEAESRVAALEGEVGQMREEYVFFRDILLSAHPQYFGLCPISSPSTFLKLHITFSPKSRLQATKEAYTKSSSTPYRTSLRNSEFKKPQDLTSRTL
jgi:hypothetical protein